jgi:polyhydroxybutyrate depolymerase
MSRVIVLLAGMPIFALAVAFLGAAPAPAAAATSTTTASTGACPTSAAASGTVTLTPTIDGHQRTVIVHPPAGYDGTKPLPLVLNLHGSQSTAVAQQAFTGMDATADANDFIVAYPQGLIAARTGYEWNVPGVPLFGGKPVPKGAADDVTFLTDLVGVLGKTYCIDPARVYATGFSGGARMSSQLGCDATGTFAAVAPVSGLRLPAGCSKSQPAPVISFHGTADPVDPYNGNGQKYWTYSVPTAAKKWAAHDGCSATPTTTQPATGVTLTSYSGCKDQSAVELYSITGEGHEWPGGPPLKKALTNVLGPQTTAISANDLMWSFFMAHPRSN